MSTDADFLVAPPDWVFGLRLDLFHETRGDQLLCDPLRRAALQRRRGNEAAVLALGCSAQDDELRIGEFDGHGRTLRVFDWGRADPGPSLTRAPDRRDRRG